MKDDNEVKRRLGCLNLKQRRSATNVSRWNPIVTPISSERWCPMLAPGNMSLSQSCTRKRLEVFCWLLCDTYWTGRVSILTLLRSGEARQLTEGMSESPR